MGWSFMTCSNSFINVTLIPSSIQTREGSISSPSSCLLVNLEREREVRDTEMAIGFMEVLLLKAKGLRETDIFAHMDPYVLLQYKGQERKSSVIHEGGSNPVWNEKIIFRVEYPGSGDQYKLNLKIFDKDVFSADDFVGQATIYVKDLLAEGAENGSAELHPRKYSVVRADQSYCGEIEVGITFTRKEEEYIGDEIGGWRESEY